MLFNFEGAAFKENGGVAQLGEHLLCKQGVIGSNPFISTNPKGLEGSIEDGFFLEQVTETSRVDIVRF